MLSERGPCRPRAAAGALALPSLPPVAHCCELGLSAQVGDCKSECHWHRNDYYQMLIAR